MSLKKQYPSLATFSMSSMTDVIFLLLIFFMVTSTLIIPSAMEVDLPQSSEQTTMKPVTEVYIDSLSQMYLVLDRNDSVAANSTPQPMTADKLRATLAMVHTNDSTRPVALYAHKTIDYGKVVEVLDMAARSGVKMVLATKAATMPQSTEPAAGAEIQ